MTRIIYMDKCGIDADYRGEERYSKLSLACAGSEEEKKINDAIEEITPQFSIQPQIYTSKTSDGRKIIIIEYHDDYDRDAGTIFEKIMKKLDIKECS
jgi:RNA binding exosome subunit